MDIIKQHLSSCKRPSNINGSPLQLVGSNQNVKENVPIADQYGSSDFGVEVLKEKNASVHGFGKDASQQDIAVPEYSLDNAGREVSFEMRMGNKSIPDEPCRSSSSNISKRSVSTVERKNYLSKETEVKEQHGNGKIEKFKNEMDVQGNKSLQEAAQSSSHKRRKRNIETGPFVLYFSYGLLDAMFQSMVYWVIGALADDSEILSRYVGFYKGVQSAGAAAAWQVDTQKVSYMSQLIVNWSLTTVSYPLLLILVLLAVKDNHKDEEGTAKEADPASAGTVHT